ncbi:MAG: Uma2 family endonuclease [Planctomycetes bacterium]|nr:Uma2 family endonuclease [Planctomycetota bacterium]
MQSTRPRRTVADYLRLHEGTLAELIDGEILLSPSRRYRHQRIVQGLFLALHAHVSSTDRGEVCVAPLDVHLPSGDVVQPDVIYIPRGRRDLIGEWIHGSPALLAEVLFPDHRERDVIVQRGLYARNGVGEYWVVDDERKGVEVLVLSGQAYRTHAWFEVGDALTSPTLPGLSLDLGAIFA